MVETDRGAVFQDRLNECRFRLAAQFPLLFPVPASDDVRALSLASAISAIARVILFIFTPGLFVGMIVVPKFAAIAAAALVFLDLMAFLLLHLVKKGHELTAGFVAVFVFLAFFLILIWLTGGLWSPCIAGLILVVLLSSLVRDARWGIASTLLVVLCLFALAWADGTGILPQPLVEYTPWALAAAYGCFFFGLGAIQYILDRSVRRVQEQTRREAEARVTGERRLLNTITYAPFAAVTCKLTEDGQDFVITRVNNPVRFAPYLNDFTIIGQLLSKSGISLMPDVVRTACFETVHGGPPCDISAVPYDGPYGKRILDIRVVEIGQHAIALFLVDVTERHKAHTAMEHIASHDQLTGLANRKSLVEHANTALAHRKQRSDHPAFLFIDLDNLKSINDTYGHAAGDELVKAVAARLTTAMRTDDVVARLGGDEFAILVSSTTDAQCIQNITKRVFSAFQAPFEIEGIEIAVTASIGVAVARPDEHDAYAFLERADRAMYHVKRSGRNGYQFSLDDRVVPDDV